MLHYKSIRGAKLSQILVGIVMAASKEYFSKVLLFEPLQSQGVDDCSHTSWRVTEVAEIGDTARTHLIDEHPNVDGIDDIEIRLDQEEEDDWAEGDGGGATERDPSSWAQSFADTDLSSGTSPQSMSPLARSITSEMSSSEARPCCFQCQRSLSKELHGLSFSQMHRLFPCHVVFNSRLKIVQMGERMRRFVPGINVGEKMDQFFRVCTPNLSWQKEWEAMEAISSVSPDFEIVTHSPSEGRRQLSFSGPLSFSDNGKFAVFLCSPNIHSLAEMVDHKISMSDMDAYGCRLQMVLQKDSLAHAQETARHMAMLTEEVRLEKEKTVRLMQEVADRAEEALATKKTFVRYVSHEIRTPLTVAKLGLNLLEKEVSSRGQSSVTQETNLDAVDISEEQVGNYIGDCQQSLDIAVSILDDLLSYEKLESGIYELFRDVVPAEPFIRNSLKMFNIQVGTLVVRLIYLTWCDVCRRRSKKMWSSSWSAQCQTKLRILCFCTLTPKR